MYSGLLLLCSILQSAIAGSGSSTPKPIPPLVIEPVPPLVSETFEGCTSPLTELGRASARVETLIPGLYESIPAGNVGYDGAITVSDDPQRRGIRGTPRIQIHLRSDKVHPNRYAWGTLVDSQHLTLTGMYLNDELGRGEKCPKTIEVPGLPAPWDKKIPTTVFTLLYLMKRNAIRPGQLREIKIDNILEAQSALQMIKTPQWRAWRAQHPDARTAPGEVIVQVFATTQLGRLANTIATQSGHRITHISSSNSVHLKPLGQLILGSIVRPGDPDFRDLVAGLSYEDQVPADFSVTLSLEPIGQRP
jgi:hypothetical protein